MGRKLRIIPYWLGYDLVKLTASSRYEYQLARYFKAYHAELVIDCGAYIGKWLETAHAAGWRGHTLAYEPNPIAFSVLQSRIAALYAHNKAINSACGNRNEVRQLHLFRDKLGSLNSLLEIDAEGTTAFSNFRSQSAIDVPVVRLDEQLALLDIPAGTSIFLKSDTQGYDMQVLEGMGDRLEDCIGVSLEMSVQRIYEDQPHHIDMQSFMRDRGFDLYGTSIVTRDEQGAIIEYDALFCRR